MTLQCYTIAATACGVEVGRVHLKASRGAVDVLIKIMQLQTAGPQIEVSVATGWWDAAGAEVADPDEVAPDAVVGA